MAVGRYRAARSPPTKLRLAINSSKATPDESSTITAFALTFMALFVFVAVEEQQQHQ
jgi:hypothetical protein